MMSFSYVRNMQPMRRQLLCGITGAIVFAMIHFVAYWLRFDEAVFTQAGHVFTTTVLWAVLVKSVVFGRLRAYQGWSRYVTFHDLLTLIKAATISAALLLVANYLFHPGRPTPRSVLLLDWGLTIVALGGLRSLARFAKESRGVGLFRHSGKRVLIVGADDSGEALLRAIRRSPTIPYCVAGFIAEDEHAVRTHIGGVPVVGVLKDTCKLAISSNVSEVLITTGELSGRQVRQLVHEASEAAVTVNVLPSYEQLLKGTVDLRPRRVSIEDLLHRDPVQLDMQVLHHWIDGRSLLVTGSAGSIGSEIARQLLQFSPKRLVLIDRSENGQFELERELLHLDSGIDIQVRLADINDCERMKGVFAEYQPDIVFHAAAYKHVPLMETHVGEAVKNITVATRRLADLADRAGVKSFVMISTDKAVNPTSVMGTCKRVAELYVQALAVSSHCRFVTVRFGNVLDSAGSVVPIFRDQIARGGPVTVTHPDMRRYFMMIPEASQLVIQAGAMGHGGEIFSLDMGESIRIMDLAVDLIELSGLRVQDDIDIEFTGIRPGEKLYEELIVDGETHVPTWHPKIMIAQCKRLGLEYAGQMVDRLEQAAECDHELLKRLLKQVVPQYQGGGPLRESPQPRRAA
ncbi:MAG: polysaccharide biosynthesis protein [Pirellulaceae bacterium]